MAISKVDRVREYINIRLYKHKSYVLAVMRVLSIGVSVFAIGAIIYYHGFPITEESSHFVNTVVNFSFIFYLFKFLTKIFYDFHPGEFIRENLFEAIIMLTIFLDLMGMLLFKDHLIKLFFSALGLTNLDSYLIIAIQLYLFIVIFIELGKASQDLAIFKIGPSGLLSLSFIVLILSGTGLLLLPEMTVKGIRAIDALFTSTSACCVTGLIVVDTATCFTLKGKIIIMLLIQLGGINIISFATFFATFYKNSSGLRTQSILKDLIATDRLSDTRNMLQKIIAFSITIEVIGALMIFLAWAPEAHFQSGSEKLFYSVFHSVSAFNNAGFSLFTDNLFDISLRHSYNMQIVIALLIFFGGIGFFVLQDIFSIRRIRERMKYKWKTLAVGSKIAIHTSLLLIAAGAIVFFSLERHRLLEGYSIYGTIVTSIFQSVTARTAGFNTVDIPSLSLPVLVFIMFLMFVGASPGSTGGGIKTTTFALLLKSVVTTIRGKKNVEMYRHTLSFDLVDRSYSLTIFALLLIFMSTFFLSITETDKSFVQLLFEEISAFGTVGLSTGITSALTDAGKVIIIITMYIGRIGTLTLALALTRKAMYTRYKYPQTSVMVG